MSYQAITDIIVNPNQLQDLQLSTTVKASPLQPSVSFSEILASYQQAEKPAETRPSESENQVNKPEALDKTEKNDKSEKAAEENQVKDEKEPEKTSEKPVEKTDSEEKSEKTGDVEEAGKKLNQKSSVKEEDSELKTTEKKTADSSESKIAKDSKDKKLSDKDFSRLEEVTAKAGAEEDPSKLAAAALDSVKSENLEIKAGDEDGEGDQLSLLSAAGSDELADKALSELQNSSEKENLDFDFSGKDEKGKKNFALDKDGKITVEDQRTKPEPEVADAKKSLVKTSEIKLTNDSTAVMSVELNPNAQADVLSLNTQTAASNGSNFQAMLSNQLHNVAPEFVKAGNLVLKDNNQGTINLVLHPDDLGNVKIHLSLDGKTLSGHITVATKEALQVFKDNSETLREAFIKSGFEGASFDVAMNNGGSFNQSSGFEGQDDGRNLFAQRAYGSSAEGLSAELDDIFENAVDISNYSVNIVA